MPYVYIAAGVSKQHGNLTKVGFGEAPRRRVKRFPKHYGIDAVFTEYARYQMPTRRLAYAVEQIILHKCRAFEALGQELFKAEAGVVQFIAERVIADVLR